MKITKKTRLLAAVPTIEKLTAGRDDAPANVIEHDSALCRMFVKHMPDIDKEENTFSVIWTKADGTTVVKQKVNCDLCDYPAYVMPEIPDGMNAGDTLRVKAVYNGIESNEVTVAVV